MQLPSIVVNMLDPIQKCYGYGQYAGRIGQDHICWIQLPASNSDPFFQRRLGSYCAILAWIQSGWPGQVLAKCIWSGNHQAQFWQYVTGLHPVTHFQTWLHSSTDGSDHSVQNQPVSGFG